MLIMKEIGYALASDSLCVMLRKKKVKRDEDGREIPLEDIPENYTTVGYYPNPNSALKGLLKTEVLNTGFEDLETVINRIDQVEKAIDKLNIQLGTEDVIDE